MHPRRIRAQTVPRARAVLGGAAAAALLAAGGCAGPTPVTGAPRAEQRPSASAAIRAERGPVRDGDLEFAVVDVAERGVAGDTSRPGLSVEARGVFIVVTLTIRNVGPTMVTFLDRYQRLVDDTGTAVRPDMAADIYSNRHLPSTRMAPGAQLLVHLCFDVPIGARPRNLVVRQSDSTSGATIALS